MAIVAGSTLSASRSCYARYYVQENAVYLQNDAGDGWASAGSPGESEVLGNNQCSIDLRDSSVSSAAHLSIHVDIIFQPNFAGPKTIWVEADDNAGDSSGWQALGTWSVEALVNIGGPVWTQIMTPSTTPQYFKYGGTSKTEIDSSINMLTLPYHFYEPASPSNDPSLMSGVCSYPAAAPDAPPFWYDFSGNRLSGEAKSTIPSEYFLSPAYSDIGFGLQLQGSFGGLASGAGLLSETAYIHQQPCDAGGMEFGFYRDVIADKPIFYFSSNSNCGIQPNSYCHVSDSYSSEFMNEDNLPGQALTSINNGVVIDNLNIAGVPVKAQDLAYSVFILPDASASNDYRFQVEVFDPTTFIHVNCDVYDARGNIYFIDKPCGFPVRPEKWYEINHFYNISAIAYVTVGIQRIGTPSVVTPVDFAVNQISVGKR